MWDELLAKLDLREDLEVAEVRSAMSSILSGAANPDQIKNFLLGLKAKGERPSEVTALVAEMFEHATLIDIPDRCVDIVGTGGDGFNTINISTPAAIVTTAAGARTIKHGNRAASSNSGAADLLEALGINIDLGADQVAQTVYKIGIGFAFAPKFHPAMRHAAPVRKAIGLPTVFNILGPLANPARPVAVAIGVARAEMFPLVAEVLAARGCEGFVFRGEEGMDELSISGPSQIFQIHRGSITSSRFDPREIGLETSPISALRGESAAGNAAIVEGIFAGKKGPARDAILLNAAAAIAAFKGDFNLAIEQQIANGYVLAKSAVDSGRASELLQRWRDLSKELAKSSL